MNLEITILIANAIILFATLVVIIFYTIETKKYRIISEKIYSLELKRLEPNVIAYFETDIGSYDIKFTLKNVGGSPAFNVKANINPQFNFGDPRIENYINDKKVFTNGLSILDIQRKYDTLVGFTTKCSEKYKKGEIPLSYDVSLNYKDDIGKEFNQMFQLRIDEFFYRLIYEDHSIRELKEVNKNLNKIDNALANITNALSKKNLK